MISQCYSWMTQILNKIRGDDDDYFAYDDGTSIVLKRRPLLQSPKPDDHHQPPRRRRNRPLILRYFCPKNLSLYIIDGDSEKECKLRGADSLENAVFVTTCNGLVLLSSTSGDRTRYGVFNPLSNEKIAIVESPNLRKSQACAFFFHPQAKEHRILVVLGGRDANGYEYQIYSFAAKRWRSTAKSSFKFRPRCSWKSENSVDGNAAVANGALHWYVGVIMVFDVMSEEFSVKILPFVDYLLQLVYFDGYLVTKGDDELCFCVVGRREAAVDVWVVEDYEDWRWCRRFKVDLSWDLTEYPVMEPCVTASYHVVRVVGFYRDEVVLFWRHRGLFVYNLSFRSVDRVWMKKLELPKDCRQTYYDLYCGFAPYVATLDDH